MGSNGRLFTKPLPYQREGYIQIERCNGRTLIADEPGLGKTYQSLLWKRRSNIHKTLVVCPASVKYVWQQQLDEHFGEVGDLLESQRPFKIKGDGIAIINYDILQYWVDEIIEWSPELIIGDEVHLLKSLSAKRTKAFRYIAEGVQYLLLLSGTPLTNRPSELFSVLNMLWPEEFPKLQPFCFRYSRPKLTPWGWVYKGAKRLDELHGRLRKLGMVRRLKKDVLKDLPPKKRIVVPMAISNAKEYRFALKDFLRWLSTISHARAKRAKRSQGLAKLMYLRRLAASLKMLSVKEWVDSFLEESDEKLVVFAIHKKIIRRLRKKYRGKCVVVDGTTPKPVRPEMVEKFKRSQKIRLFIGNIQAAGQGINGLQEAASNTAVIEMPWTPAEALQLEDRTHRFGQKKKSFYYYLVAKNTIEEKLVRMLEEKQEVLSATLDGAVQSDDLDVYSRLLKELGREK